MEWVLGGEEEQKKRCLDWLLREEEKRKKHGLDWLLLRGVSILCLSMPCPRLPGCLVEGSKRERLEVRGDCNKKSRQ